MKQGTKIFIWAVVAGVVAYGVWHLAALRSVGPHEVPPVEGAAETPKAPLPEDIVGERMADTNYVMALKGLIDERSEVITEVHAVRDQMEEMLADAKDKVPVTSSSTVDAPQEPELEAAATLAVTNTPVVPTNTALTAGTELRAPSAVRFAGVDPALLTYVRQQPDWTALETRLDALEAKQHDVKIRTETLISERMKVQYAARAAENTEPLIRPPARIIKPMTNAPDYNNVERTIITNVPPEGKKLPPRPERVPVK